jgi:hypothetical protein
MSETDSSVVQPVKPDAVVARREDSDEYGSEFDFAAAMAWIRSHSVLVAGLALILGELAWKAQFLSHMYFSQDDYVNLDIASKSPLNWSYLTRIGSGHLFPGLRVITWVLARISLYGWGLDAGAALVLVAATGLAALRLLRTLFGDRPAILIPLAFYVLTPLTVPDLGWWFSAMESLPMQLAIFMALNAHILYVRTGRNQHLVAAAVWLAIGMIFFEKAFVLAPLIFAITAAFLTESKSWLAGTIVAARRYWHAWLVYGVLMLGYAALFITSFKASGQGAFVSSSPSAIWTFVSTMVKDNLVTGALGGPWRWIPIPDGLQAIASPPGTLAVFAAVATIAAIVVSVMRRGIAWRAWVILAGWVICADMMPVVFGRLYHGMQTVLGLETRYLADASCVLAICVGLAFLPVTHAPTSEAAERSPSPRSRRRRVLTLIGEQNLRYGGAVLVAVFVVGSIWSVQAYESSTPGGSAARTYIANAKRAVTLAPRGTTVIDQYMPQNMVTGLFGRQEAAESTVIGDMELGKLAGKLRWLRNPVGTVDGLHVFGSNGKLYPAVIAGDYSVHRPGSGFQVCWPERHGRITVRLQHVTDVYDWTLNIAYIWGGSPATVTVYYAGVQHSLVVLSGVHNAYLPVSGYVSSFVVSGLGQNHLCLAGAESGHLVPFGTPIP